MQSRDNTTTILAVAPTKAFAMVRVDCHWHKDTHRHLILVCSESSLPHKVDVHRAYQGLDTSSTVQFPKQSRDDVVQERLEEENAERGALFAGGACVALDNDLAGETRKRLDTSFAKGARERERRPPERATLLTVGSRVSFCRNERSGAVERRLLTWSGEISAIWNKQL